jgi:transcriptional regulator with XRE-family HTH domain
MGERLRAAREKAGYDSAKAAAEAMGIAVSTYLQHESGIRGYTRQVGRYARFFKVRPEMLAFGTDDGLNEEVLRRMLEITLRELPRSTAIGDWPRLAAASLHTQIVRFRADHARTASTASKPAKPV